MSYEPMREFVGLTINVRSCARCGGDHPALQFLKLQQPMVLENAFVLEPGTQPDLDAEARIVWTHWATCPTNQEPIMLRPTARVVSR